MRLLISDHCSWLLPTLLFAAFVVGCASGSSALPGTVVDLTYPFDRQTIYWPGNKTFTWERQHWGMIAEGYWYASGSFAASEHGGTHLDAPIHFAPYGRRVHEIPPDQFIGPAVVIDVRQKVRANPDYAVQVKDLDEWEAQYGRVPKGAVVLALTGWGARWPDRSRYLGTTTPEDPATFHFPGFSPEVVEKLVRHRHIHGIGIDTASIDTGQAQRFPVHRIISEANLYALENVARMEQLPPHGATLLALPMLIRNGTGAPVRILAIVP
ncbi:MAG: cyclase family protein [Nitrospirae bacterium]|nr:MAG: cyclase family protein [Nitrospirota bacterium]